MVLSKLLQKLCHKISKNTRFIENLCKDSRFYNTMQYKVLKICILNTYFLILLNGSSKIRVKFAYVRKNVYLCRLLCASARSRE
jgi:hypothetical protein